LKCSLKRLVDSIDSLGAQLVGRDRLRHHS
jgi:hypothetical protein